MHNILTKSFFVWQNLIIKLHVASIPSQHRMRINTFFLNNDFNTDNDQSITLEELKIVHYVDLYFDLTFFMSLKFISLSWVLKYCYSLFSCYSIVMLELMWNNKILIAKCILLLWCFKVKNHFILSFNLDKYDKKLKHFCKMIHIRP